MPHATSVITGLNFTVSLPDDAREPPAWATRVDEDLPLHLAVMAGGALDQQEPTELTVLGASPSLLTR